MYMLNPTQIIYFAFVPQNNLAYYTLTAQRYLPALLLGVD